jgi:hypothetical protein
MINDVVESFWDHMTPWNMHVTDERNRLLFTLQFGAKVPSGEARYIPDPDENDIPHSDENAG